MEGQQTGFAEGNAEQFYAAIANVPNVLASISKTVEPIIILSLRELLAGNGTTQYSKKAADIELVIENGIPKGIKMAMQYLVPDFQGVTMNEEAVAKDTEFLMGIISRAGEIFDEDPIDIDLEAGTVTFIFSVAI